MSRSVTFRLPDHLYPEVAKVCERRKIDLTSFMLGAVRGELGLDGVRLMSATHPPGAIEKLAEKASTIHPSGKGKMIPYEPPVRLAMVSTGPQHPKPGSLLKGKKK